MPNNNPTEKLIHFLFALKPNTENSSFSFVLLANSLESAKSAYLQNVQDIRGLLSVKELEEYDLFINSCFIYCLGSIDYISGELVSNVENTNVLLKDLLEVVVDA